MYRIVVKKGEKSLTIKADHFFCENDERDYLKIYFMGGYFILHRDCIVSIKQYHPPKYRKR